jgi:hypothetical protein
MTIEHTELLKAFLKEKGTNTNVLFQDNIDNKLVDLSVWYEISNGNVYIAGDEGELYSFDELDLIDGRIIIKDYDEDDYDFANEVFEKEEGRKPDMNTTKDMNCIAMIQVGIKHQRLRNK